MKDAVAAVSHDRDGAERIGTAFRIAPNYAVTAAHVADGAARLRLAFGDGADRGCEVVAASAAPPGGGRWGFDDLAVLRLDEPDRVAAPCVLMSEPVLTPGDELLVCALNASYVERVVELYRNYRFRDKHERFFTVDGDRSVIQGMSGGPVWSVRHGGVVGFLKASENLQSPQGGAVAYLLDGLRRCDRGLYEEIVTAHDARHRDEAAWTDRLVGAEAPVRRWVVELQGWLAAISAAADRRVPAALVGELFRDSFAPDSGRLVTLRDLVEYIGTESQDPPLHLARFCALAPNYLPESPHVARGLREIPKKLIPPRDLPEFERRFAVPRAESAEVTTLFGIIVPEEGPRIDEHAPLPHRYELARRTGEQEIITLPPTGRFPTYDQAKRELKRAIDIELTTIDKPLDAVEIVVALPDDHLTDDPLYEWRRADERPFSKFMMRLRRSATWEKNSEQLAELDLRWNRLRRHDSDRMVWLGCDDPRGRALRELQVLFADDDPPDGLGVSEPPTEHVLAASRTNALPVSLWRVASCPEHPGGAACDGTLFRRHVATRIGESSPLDWYTAIWREQRDHTRSVDRDEFWRKIVCIIDRPGESRRRPPPLAGPGATRELI
nr:serine protease [Nocardia bovistercoris]